MYDIYYNLALVACILHTLAAECWNWHWHKIVVISTSARPNFTSQMEGDPALKPSLSPPQKPFKLVMSGLYDVHWMDGCTVYIVVGSAAP